MALGSGGFGVADDTAPAEPPLCHGSGNALVRRDFDPDPGGRFGCGLGSQRGPASGPSDVYNMSGAAVENLSASYGLVHAYGVFFIAAGLIGVPAVLLFATLGMWQRRMQPEVAA